MVLTRLAHACRGCLILIACYAGLGTVVLGFAFIRSTWAFTGGMLPDGREIVAMVALLLVLAAWVVLPIPLLFTGLVHLRRVARGRLRLPAAWACAVTVGTALEWLILYHLFFDTGSDSFVIPPMADWDWAAFPQAAGLLVLSVAMLWILWIAERSAVCRPGELSPEQRNACELMRKMKRESG